ncbi:MAG: discoidin domain-containing protein [Sedimentisphaerales bacterium]|nr:discoidin domain-containing protein [Sedimentisphaerales bacterium]
MSKSKKLQSAVLLIVLACISNSPLSRAAEKIIYFDDFSGTGPLNGTAPDMRPGEQTWIASSVYNASGIVGRETPNGYTYQALLPFSPEAGKVYTLSLDVDPRDSADSTTWFALGFTSSGAVESAAGNDQFYESGVGWILHRVTRSRSENDEIQTFLGPGEEGSQSHESKEQGFVTLSVILDARTSRWTVEWFRNGRSIRGPEAFEENPEINYVGFTKFLNTSGAVDNFKLTTPNPTIASGPSPSEEETNAPIKTILQWEPGIFADTHDLYFGTDAISVENATPTDDPASVYLGRFDLNHYPESGTILLEFEQTYFWRVDEVNAPADNTVYKGEVWSFTAEPLAAPVPGERITATASSQAPGQGPENTINESGLIDELHSTQTKDMWATAEGQALPAWIQYEFDKPCQLHEMLVWNYNGSSFLTAVGIQDVTVEYSIDGVDWILNDSISVFNQATGKNNYAANTTIPFGDVPVKFVKITAATNWSGNFFVQFGLSEVRFLQIPVSTSKPVPEDGASGVDIDLVLKWRAGREADEHKVYISTDEQAVTEGTVAPVTLAETGYSPLSLDLGTTYYWRVDEVNNAEETAVWEGGTWSFATSEYRVVDDFESYNDIPAGQEGSNLIYLTWIDGYDNPSTNGSTMGYTTGASLETATVRSGRSAPLMYNNTIAGVSKVTANAGDLPGGSDWMVGSPEQLVLWIYGSADNNSSTDRMYAEIGGVKRIFSGDIALEQWQDFPIDLASLGVNLSNVDTVTIGLEKTGSTGGSGTVFIDDIQLYRSL